MKYVKLFEQYLNDNFWKWFGNSKVIDDKGNPLVVYHGTPNDVEYFSNKHKGTRTNHIPDDVGFHFTNQPRYAEVYSKYQDVRNDDIFFKHVGRYPKTQDKSIKPNIIPVYLKMETPYIHEELKPISKSIIDKAKIGGCDGIIWYGNNGSQDEYVVFEPTQIKSAIGNNGNFNNELPKITETKL